MKITKWMLAASLLVAACLAAVPVPDYSGTWKLNNDKSTQDGPADRVVICKIQQDKGSVTITTDSKPAPAVPELDGTFLVRQKAVVKTSAGHFHSERAYFEAGTLILEVVDRDGPAKKPTQLKAVRESWILSRDGKILNRFRQTAGSGKVVDQKYVFDKQ